MRRLTQWSGAPWLAMGLAIGALLAPAAAVAAVGLVKIVGSNGKRAEVTAANQLLTVAAPPAAWRSTWTGGVGPVCTPLYKAPAGKGFIVTQALLDVYLNPTPGIANWIGLFSTATCGDGGVGIITIVNAGGVGLTAVPFTPGFALKAGASIYGMTFGGVRGEVTIMGYLVPKSAVPKTTSTLARPGQSGANVDGS